MSDFFLYVGFTLYIAAVIAVERDRGEIRSSLQKPKVSLRDFYPSMLLGFVVDPFLRPRRNPFSFAAATAGVALVIIDICT